MLIRDKDGYWRMTRLAAHLRYIHTIKPLDDIVSLFDEERRIQNELSKKQVHCLCEKGAQGREVNI